uniref:NADH-quinone oxidoreductase subunit M n=1 Tax=Thermogemmatispora argillosa TaxID=2045280 RepID=A0A455T2R6_9CHLR|nr:NADH-quinone oxidoreductase subunit M [Thermogemmatispora argillosa]
MIFAYDLTWILLLPTLGGVLAMVTPVRLSRWVALVFSAATLALSLWIFLRIALATGYHFGSVTDLKADPASIDVVQLPWIQFQLGSVPFRIDYYLGVDGLSLPLVILNALLTLLAVIGGWEKPRVKEYMALLLLLEAGVMGVFMALDLLLFFLFWEVELAPMFLLIGIWGSETEKHGMPGRIYSAWKFLLYTFFGSIFMLAGILLVYFQAGQNTASLPVLMQHLLPASTGVTIPLLGVTMGSQLLAFLLVFVAFAVKIPMFPLHTWLPDAHTDAPTEVSVILAGVLLKMGAYGLIRICLGLFPDGLQQFAPLLVVLAVINILYGAAICLVQKDMKRLVAYSSVSHMGVILLGVAAAAMAVHTSNPDVARFGTAALMGATVQMISHGLITSLLFFCVGVIYDRAHTREIEIFGGVAKRMPLWATLFTFAGLASLGLPGLAGFVAEYMVFTSSYRIWPVPTAIAVFTMILTAAYLLWMLKRVLFGPFNLRWNWLPDATWREAIPLVTLAAFIVLVGIYPGFLLDVIVPALHHLLPVATTALGR